MYTAQINLYPCKLDSEIETDTLRLYLMIRDLTAANLAEAVRMRADRDSGRIIAADCDPELIAECVDTFTEAVAAAGREIRTHLRICEDNTLEQFA